ncbi:tRNA pseudouridine32 synthase/23S rRNA pseudouridine746 synthase [Silvimonas terrae]|uniref:tRNA pseudouridine32 synthase/23S rRNA pseudouridine746 synthase n=1 Tax=Silvimonas terrae TaxID=300266 RepID=A0A840RKA1_9NEIS|nr:pseudouridine synthase [Silvimonas terrae]MBB5192948.1 tRNA pseudouridine32 synthase/23S rRNA pseudouridine746 synthase [Silvimonas terrae]
MKPKPSIPWRDGVAPSFVLLPEQGNWPDLQSFLLHRFPHLPADVIATRLATGEIMDDAGLPVSGGDPYQPGSRLWYFREVPDEEPVPFQAQVLYRDERILVADKPHFLATVPSGRRLRETLLNRLRRDLDLPELTPVHRLDRETAGLVMFCLHPPSRGLYQSLFESRQVSKVYEAVAPLNPALVLPLVHRSRLEQGSHFFTSQEVAGAPNSETRLSLLQDDGQLGWYQLEPHTGKKHQLRAHMSALGIPICNDPWYPQVQADAPDDFTRPLQLLARSLAFVDPVSGESRQFRSERALNWPV